MSKGLFLYFFMVAFWFHGQAQNADKYADAYKAYADAVCPVTRDSIQHFVYFATDRKAIIDHPFLSHPLFSGAQIMYAWRDFEPRKGRYDFSRLAEDYNYLRKYGKKIFVQLQDATFNPAIKAVPDYLLSAEYDGGATIQYNDDSRPEGWVAKRWNAKVRERFALLLQALAKAFDGKIEGLNLQETAIGVSRKTDSSFSEEKYVQGLQQNMLAMRKAFKLSTVMIYANFIPGEWLPWTNKGYLQSIYDFGEKNGIGLGGPDLMVTRRGQLNHLITMMHERHFTVPLGIAIQDGNYVGATGADQNYEQANDDGKTNHKNIVPLLYAFAKDFLRVKYMFWVNQEPYFASDVLPCFSTR